MRANVHHVSRHSRSVSAVACPKTSRIPARDCFCGVARDRTFYDHADPVSRNFHAQVSTRYDDVILFGAIGVAFLLSIPPKEEAKAVAESR